MSKGFAFVSIVNKGASLLIISKYYSLDITIYLYSHVNPCTCFLSFSFFCGSAVSAIVVAVTFIITVLAAIMES